MLRVLSLGAGVQSSVLLLMSCRGELPKLDAAVFADVQWEPKAVYENLEWLKTQAAVAGIPLHTVSAGNIKESLLRSRPLTEGEHGTRFASLPLFVKNADGSQGRMRRQCTKEFKWEPIERFIKRELLGLSKGQRAPADAVEHWYGISMDERRRARGRTSAWEINEYPLIGLPTHYLDRRYTRADCLTWFAQRYPDRKLPRSACIGCPNADNKQLRRLRDESPEEWADAVAFDASIRTLRCGMNGATYVHRDMVPLDEVDLSTAEERGQESLWDDECGGHCGC